jgi:hypothetical protein
MSALKTYISSQLDIILSEADNSKRSKAEVEAKLKALGLPKKAIKKAIEKMKDNFQIIEPSYKEEIPNPKKIHSKKKIQDILQIRESLRGKTSAFVEKNMLPEKDAFVKHYNDLFNKGVSEMPGIMELYSILAKNKMTRTPAGKGFIFKMTPEDAKLYGKEIVKYFLVKNADFFPIGSRIKMALDSYLMLMELSGVDKAHVQDTKNLYYTKFNLSQA